MSEARAEVRIGPARVPLADTDTPVTSVEGRDTVRLRAEGLTPGEPVVLSIGGLEATLSADNRGTLVWQDTEALHAVAGRVPLCLLRASGSALSAQVDILPTKLAQLQLEMLIQELEALLPGLAGDLGGRARRRVDETSPAEGTLQLLESTVGAMADAATWVRQRPLHRVIERPLAVPSATACAQPRDIRWLTRHPSAAARVRMRASEVTVRRDRIQDFDVPENRGVLGLLDHLEALADALQDVLDAEQERILALRPEREAFATRRSSLYAQFDVPRLQAIDARRSSSEVGTSS